MIGGALATAGGVVFVGTPDREFLAFDARSVNQLWRYQGAGGVNAPPMTYSIDGTQYVAVPAGGNFQINSLRSDELLVFSLRGGATSTGTAQNTDTTRRSTADSAAKGGE